VSCKNDKKIIFISTCKYRINISTTKELIAYNKNLEEIKKQIGADELVYRQ